jgi:hypothetical protein
MSPESLGRIIDGAFSNQYNVIPDERQTAYGKALHESGDEHSRIFNKMVRANMGFNVEFPDEW